MDSFSYIFVGYFCRSVLNLAAISIKIYTTCTLGWQLPNVYILYELGQILKHAFA